jgi:hypothetical protein
MKPAAPSWPTIGGTATPGPDDGGHALHGPDVVEEHVGHAESVDPLVTCHPKVSSGRRLAMARGRLWLMSATWSARDLDLDHVVRACQDGPGLA